MWHSQAPTATAVGSCLELTAQQLPAPLQKWWMMVQGLVMEAATGNTAGEVAETATHGAAAQQPYSGGSSCWLS